MTVISGQRNARTMAILGSMTLLVASFSSVGSAFAQDSTTKSDCDAKIASIRANTTDGSPERKDAYAELMKFCPPFVPLVHINGATGASASTTETTSNDTSNTNTSDVNCKALYEEISGMTNRSSTAFQIDVKNFSKNCNALRTSEQGSGKEPLSTVQTMPRPVGPCSDAEAAYKTATQSGQDTTGLAKKVNDCRQRNFGVRPITPFYPTDAMQKPAPSSCDSLRGMLKTIADYASSTTEVTKLEMIKKRQAEVESQLTKCDAGTMPIDSVIPDDKPASELPKVITCSVAGGKLLCPTIGVVFDLQTKTQLGLPSLAPAIQQTSGENSISAQNNLTFKCTNTNEKNVMTKICVNSSNDVKKTIVTSKRGRLTRTISTTSTSGDASVFGSASSTK